jgi:hypothetical protein
VVINISNGQLLCIWQCILQTGRFFAMFQP